MLLPRLIEIRKERKLSQNAVAKVLDIPQQQYSSVQWAPLSPAPALILISKSQPLPKMFLPR